MGSKIHENTRQATTGPFDQQLNEFECGAPAVKASVWFTYTAAAQGAIVLDTHRSSYSTGVMVFRNKPSLHSMLGCGPDKVALDAAAGATYTFMVFSDSSQQGGRLAASFVAGPPDPKVSASVDPTGTVTADGDAAISGTITCRHTDVTFVDGSLTQIWKRLKITGGFFRRPTYQGKIDWSAVVSSEVGTYAPGAATAATRHRSLRAGRLYALPSHQPARRALGPRWPCRD